AEIGAAIALGTGRFPAGYWHRTSASQLRARIAQDAKVIKERDGGVRVRSNAPGEWMNQPAKGKLITHPIIPVVATDRKNHFWNSRNAINTGKMIILAK